MFLFSQLSHGPAGSLALSTERNVLGIVISLARDGTWLQQTLFFLSFSSSLNCDCLLETSCCEIIPVTPLPTAHLTAGCSGLAQGLDFLVYEAVSCVPDITEAQLNLLAAVWAKLTLPSQQSFLLL